MVLKDSVVEEVCVEDGVVVREEADSFPNLASQISILSPQALANTSLVFMFHFTLLFPA